MPQTLTSLTESMRLYIVKKVKQTNYQCVHQYYIYAFYACYSCYTSCINCCNCYACSTSSPGHFSLALEVSSSKARKKRPGDEVGTCFVWYTYYVCFACCTSSVCKASLFATLQNGKSLCIVGSKDVRTCWDILRRGTG